MAKPTYTLDLVKEGTQNVKVSEKTLTRLVSLLQENKDDLTHDDESEIVAWLGESSDYSRECKMYDRHESAIKRYCLSQVLERDFIIHETKWFEVTPHKVISKPALFESKEVVRDEKKTIPRRVIYFVEHKEDSSLWAIRVHTWDDDDSEVVIHTNQHHEKVQKVWSLFRDYFIEHGPLKGECFTPELKWLKLNKRTWKDVILSDEVKDALDLNLIEFIKNLHTYKSHNLPTNRGILFAGQPGTGKTLTIDVLLNLFSDMTRIYATSETLYSRNAIKNVFELARKFSPCVVVIEDIDTIASSDDDDWGGGRTPLVGEILTALNGAESNDGVITIATTNYPDSLDVALRDRPGRFDCRIDFGVPNADNRKLILQKYLFDFNTTKLNIKTITKETEGFTGAWIREVVVSAFALALRKKGALTITNDNLNRALRSVKDTRKKTNRRRVSTEDSDELFG